MPRFLFTGRPHGATGFAAQQAEFTVPGCSFRPRPGGQHRAIRSHLARPGDRARAPCSAGVTHIEVAADDAVTLAQFRTWRWFDGAPGFLEVP